MIQVIELISHRHTPAQFLQMTTQRLMDAQSGLMALQSAQILLDLLDQIFSATS